MELHPHLVSANVTVSIAPTFPKGADELHRSVIGERERAYLVVLTVDFSLYIMFITGAGRHHTVMFYVILNTRTNVKFHKGSTKIHALEARLFGCS